MFSIESVHVSTAAQQDRTLVEVVSGDPFRLSEATAQRKTNPKLKIRLLLCQSGSTRLDQSLHVHAVVAWFLALIGSNSHFPRQPELSKMPLLKETAITGTEQRHCGNIDVCLQMSMCYVNIF